jgi:hypothetical protein
MATVFDQVLGMYAALPDERMGQTWTWREGGPALQVRDALYRSLEEEQAAASVAGAGTEAVRILALAQRAFGDLRGLLAGLDEPLLDAAPAPDEWPLRQTLRHVLTSELRYDAHTGWARRRGESDPIRIPEPMLPAEPDAAGSLSDLLGRLAKAREQSDRRHSSTSPHEMTRPTIWAGFDVDVRFRLHRFGGHLAEHTVQCEKTLALLDGFRDSEARRIVRRISAMRGLHEHVSEPAVLDGLDREHERRARSLAP